LQAIADISLISKEATIKALGSATHKVSHSTLRSRNQSLSWLEKNWTMPVWAWGPFSERGRREFARWTTSYGEELKQSCVVNSPAGESNGESNSVPSLGDWNKSSPTSLRAEKAVGTFSGFTTGMTTSSRVKISGSFVT
jgi:hypothetical protein